MGDKRERSGYEVEAKSGGKERQQRLAGGSAGGRLPFPPGEAASPGDLLLACRDVQMGTINKGTLPFLSPSESALPGRLSVFGLGRESWWGWEGGPAGLWMGLPGIPEKGHLPKS